MPEKHVDSMDFELQSLLGQQETMAKDSTATATVSDKRLPDKLCRTRSNLDRE